ncbi:hypothetical protein D9613_001352 [Agrocybe pediades]|uniref:CNNM transmembrane domain-containing protein n=1 Tax=Agrocybe pediades TaxID=84607 RepID=A0A8H4VX38_9AGAR|nr:hypothetical protein D9613_001352 [Agrocybe pediades]
MAPQFMFGLSAPTLIALVRVVSASPHYHALRHSGKKHRTGHPGAEPGSEEFWYHLIVSIFLVLAGGVFAGLTLGLMGLDELHLRVLATSSEDLSQRRNAQRVKMRPTAVLRLMQKGKHWVLVIVNESLPIFLDSALGGGYTAIAISTAAIGAKCAPLVLGMMFILAPVAWPIAKVLDWVLGTKEQHTYKKAELKSFLQFHRSGDEPLRDEEITILNGVLELNTKKVEEIMTPLADTVILSTDDVLDFAAVHAILQTGYSRFPVHEKGNKDAFVGILLVKMEIISEEIVDETDRYEDNHSKRRARRQTTPSVLESIVERRALVAGTHSETSSLLTVAKRAVSLETRTPAYGSV